MVNSIVNYKTKDKKEKKILEKNKINKNEVIIKKNIIYEKNKIKMQRFSLNPKDGFYNMMKRNQKYNNISNGLNINNNMNKKN